MRAVLVQNMREKYAEFGEICAKICGIYLFIIKIVHEVQQEKLKYTKEICCIYAALRKYAA